MLKATGLDNLQKGGLVRDWSHSFGFDHPVDQSNEQVLNRAGVDMRKQIGDLVESVVLFDNGY